MSWGGSSSAGESISLLEAEAGSDGSASEVLEGVQHHVVNGTLVGVADSKGDGGNVLGTSVESVKDGIRRDAENLGWEDGTVVEELQDLHLVEEWSDLELIEESSLTWSDLLTLSDDLDGVNNLDLRLDNLGLNVKGLEERGLLWIHTSWTSWDGNISVSEGTNLGWGLSNLGVNNLLDTREITIGEDKTSVQLKSVSDQSELWAGLAVLLIFIDHLLDSLSHEGLNEKGVRVFDKWAC